MNLLDPRLYQGISLDDFLFRLRFRDEDVYRDGPPQQILASGLIKPDFRRTWGIDGSHWNAPPLDMVYMKSLGMSFAIFKACDGSVNSRYCPEHVSQAELAELPFGLYFWLYPNSKVSISTQVTAWVNRYKDFPGQLGGFIDAERTIYAGQVANPTTKDLNEAHQRWEDKTGEKATTYTAQGYGNEFLLGFPFDQYPLWIANYRVLVPNLPKGATTWRYWQVSESLDGKWLDPNGKTLSFDLNYINEEVQGEEPMPDVIQRGTCLVNTKIRNVNIDDNATQTGLLSPGDIVFGVVSVIKGLNRISFTKIYRKSGEVHIWEVGSNSAVQDGSTVLIKLDNTPEPVEEEPIPNTDVVTKASLEFKADGTVTGTWQDV